MDIIATNFSGVCLMQSELKCDDRGSFERIWSAQELCTNEFSSDVAQVSLARNHIKGTVRGLHYSVEPDEEVKFLRCVRGKIFDVVVDLRPSSATYRTYLEFHLKAGDGTTLRIPPGFAHGYQTLADDTDIIYLIDRPFVPSSARVIRYNDPSINVLWPLPVTCVSERDARGDEDLSVQ
jgi:dTDP-4-dehydrorhamnose 3,5-epimerase